MYKVLAKKDDFNGFYLDEEWVIQWYEHLILEKKVFCLIQIK